MTEVLEELVKARKALKKKFRSLKMDKANTQERLEDSLKPITNPLKEFIDISSKRKRISNDEKEEIKNEIKSEIDSDINLSLKQLPMKLDASTPKKEFINNEYKTTDDEIDFYSQTEASDNNTINNTTISSIDLSYLGRKNELDTLYGPHKDSNGEWKFGNSYIKLNEDKIMIGNQNWLLTPGLVELMFHRMPKNYDKTELGIYKKILIDTSAHKRDFKSDGQIKGTRAYKYQHIISKLFKPDKTGSGIMKLNSSKTNYVYWDDPNELVDRLRLLIASKDAGHNNHNNEIVSIIEELQEAGIIV